MTEPGTDEFAPLPYFPWISRPESVPLTDDECATALFLDHGHIDNAARRLKVDPRLLRKSIRRSYGLRLLLERLAAARPR